MAMDEQEAATTAQVGRGIRAQREARGWSLADLTAALEAKGHRLGIGAISRLERGQRRIDVEDLAALARAFSCHIIELFGDGDEWDERLEAASQVANWAALGLEAKRLRAEAAGVESRQISGWENLVFQAARSNIGKAIVMAELRLAGFGADVLEELERDAAKQRADLLANPDMADLVDQDEGAAQLSDVTEEGADGDD